MRNLQEESAFVPSPRDRVGGRTYIGTFHPAGDDDVASIPEGPSLVRVSWDPEGEWVLVLSTRDVVRQLALEGIAVDYEPTIWYRTGFTSSDLPCESIDGWILPASAIRAGRPTLVTGITRVPEAWGLYRIKRMDRSAYVGISSNLRIRLRTHIRNGVLRPESGDSAEYMLAKQSSDGRIVTWAALAEAEKQHIARLQDRGYRLDNRTVGGNARPPSVQINL